MSHVLLARGPRPGSEHQRVACAGPTQYARVSCDAGRCESDVRNGVHENSQDSSRRRGAGCDTFDSRADCGRRELKDWRTGVSGQGKYLDIDHARQCGRTEPSVRIKCDDYGADATEWVSGRWRCCSGLVTGASRTEGCARAIKSHGAGRA